MRKSSTDLTEGNIIQQIVLFALPIMLGQIFQNLYNSVDAIVVGNYVGTTALAAVSSSSDIAQLLNGFFTGMSTGCGILFARYFGAKDYQKVHDSIHTALTFAISLGLAMAVLGIIFTPFLLNVVGCPQDVYDQAAEYLRIYLAGILFTSLYNVGAGVLRAVGDSRTPFYILVISSCVNIVLDLLFVVLFRMGVMGVAFATIISQFSSVCMVYFRLLHTDDVYKVTLSHLKIDRELLKEVIDLGLPTAIQSSLISTSNLFVQRYINSFGSAAMAGIGAAKKIDKFAGLISQSMGLSITTFVSQNYGAQRLDRAFKGIRQTLILNFIMVACMGTVIFSFAPFFVNIFTKDAAAAGFGVGMIRVMMPLYIFQALNAIFSGATRGFGRSRNVMLLSIFGMVVCRQIFLAITMSIEHNVRFVYFGYPVGWGFSALFVYIYYRHQIKNKFKNQLEH